MTMMGENRMRYLLVILSALALGAGETQGCKADGSTSIPECDFATSALVDCMKALKEQQPNRLDYLIQSKKCLGARRTLSGKVSCDMDEFVASWKAAKGTDYKHYEGAISLHVETVKALAADYDAGKATESAYEGGYISALLLFAQSSLAVDQWLKERDARLLEERRVRAQEQANRIEAQKICIRLTGRLCPVR
jgi:hypothetical protein